MSLGVLARSATHSRISSFVRAILLSLGALLIAGVLTWQAVVLHGTPDPTAKGMSPLSLAVSSAVLVLREGLEAVLVLAVITAGAIRNKANHWRSVMVGVAAALAATVATWFIVVSVLSSINAPALQIQAGTGLLAVVVLLVISNWFAHGAYWGGWIGHHSKRKQQLLKSGAGSKSGISLGMAMLGFTCIYREGFEIVLFLQDLRLKGGSGIVLSGAGIGLSLTAIVAALTFVAHRKLPYKKMLIATGLMLAAVLIVMVGESAQEMQLAGWLTTHPLPLAIPDWMGTWFAAFPNVEGLAAQVLAAVLVFGSYAWVRWQVKRSVTLCGKTAPQAKTAASEESRSPSIAPDGGSSVMSVVEPR